MKHRVATGNPALGMFKPPQAKARDRVLTDDELRRFWPVTVALDYPFGPILQLLLLTGQREGEVAGMRWSELSADLATWMLPGGRTKNGRSHVVPLPPMARRIIEAVHIAIEGCPLVFTTNGRTTPSGFSKVKRRLDAQMSPDAPWRLHDLRRTAVTGMSEIGIQPHIVEATVNHISGYKAGIAGVYNRAEYLPERKAALERWASQRPHWNAGPATSTASCPGTRLTLCRCAR